MSAPAAGSNFLRFRTISAPFHPRGCCGWGQPRSGSGGLKEPPNHRNSRSERPDPGNHWRGLGSPPAPAFIFMARLVHWLACTVQILSIVRTDPFTQGRVPPRPKTSLPPAPFILIADGVEAVPTNKPLPKPGLKPAEPLLQPRYHKCRSPSPTTSTTSLMILLSIGTPRVGVIRSGGQERKGGTRRAATSSAASSDATNLRLPGAINHFTTR